MATSQCTQSKIDALKKRLAGLPGEAKNATVAAIKQALAVACQVATAQLAVLVPLLAVHEIIIENFILFPIDTVAARLQETAETIERPFRNIGIDNKCPDTKKANKAVKALTRPLSTLGNALKNKSDSARKFIDGQTEALENLQSICDVSAAFEDL